MITPLSAPQLRFSQNYNLHNLNQTAFSSNVPVNTHSNVVSVPLETHKAYTLVNFEGKKQPFPEQLASTAREIAESMNTDDQCKLGVRKSLEKYGMTLKGVSAYMAADQIAKNPMFTELKVKRSELKDLKPGTVVVWDKCKGHPHGHISIALGEGKEASSCIRDQFVDYGPEFRVFEPKSSNLIKNKLISRPTIAMLHAASKAKNVCMDAIRGKSDIEVKKLELDDESRPAA